MGNVVAPKCHLPDPDKNTSVLTHVHQGTLLLFRLQSVSMRPRRPVPSINATQRDDGRLPAYQDEKYRLPSDFWPGNEYFFRWQTTRRVLQIARAPGYPRVPVTAELTRSYSAVGASSSFDMEFWKIFVLSRAKADACSRGLRGYSRKGSPCS